MELHIQTLGGLRVYRDGEELTRLAEQPTRLALLVYLAMERDVTRDVVQGVIWSELPPDRARHALNQTLYLLRKELGDDWIVAEGERLRVTEDLSADALDFEKEAETGSPGEALPLYKGDFLQGWYLRDTPEFEHWTDRIRLRLSRLYRETCRSALSELTRARRTEEALAVAQTWVRRNPRADEAQRTLIELLARSGRRAEALEQYEAYENALATEHFTPPSDTLELVERLRSGGPLPPLGSNAHGTSGEQISRSPDAKSGHRETPASPGRSRIRVGRLLAAAAVLVAAVFLGFATLQDRSPAPVLDPNRVLVYPLENRTGDVTLDPAGMLAADWITRSLARADFLEVFPTSELTAVADSPTGEDGTPEEHLARAQAAAQEAGCGTLVTGAYYDEGPEVEFHAQILQAPDWELLESVGPILADRGDPMEAVDVLGQRVLIGLAFQRDESLMGMFTESERPPSYAAYVAYVEGFRRIMLDQWREAATTLMRANEISPDFTAPLIPAAVTLVRGWGDFEAADSVLRIVEASRDRLPPYDRLRFDLVQATVQGDHRRAYRAAQEAAALVPGGTAQYAAGQFAVEINRPGEALAWLGGVDPTQRATRNWTLYWDMLTQAHHLLGEHSRELQEARRTRERISERIEPVWYETRALAALGRLSEIHPLLDQSQRLNWTPEVNPGLVLVRTAEELQAHGHSDGAQEILARFPAWYESLDPQQKARPDVRVLLGRSHYLAGRLDEARQLFSELRTEIPGNPLPVRYLGTIAARTGDFEAARTWSRELEAMTGIHLLGLHTLGRAAIAARLGEPAQAVSLLRRAVIEGVRFGAVLHSDPDLTTLTDYPPYQELMRPEA
jgi:DNA-binding SARP family transcriptional activator